MLHEVISNLYVDQHRAVMLTSTTHSLLLDFRIFIFDYHSREIQSHYTLGHLILIHSIGSPFCILLNSHVFQQQ